MLSEKNVNAMLEYYLSFDAEHISIVFAHIDIFMVMFQI